MLWLEDGVTRVVVSLSKSQSAPIKSDMSIHITHTDHLISFVMPAIFDSLVHQQGLTPHVAWRVAFIVPFILITFTAITMLIFCPDTPVGSWADRHSAVVTTGIVPPTSSEEPSPPPSTNEKDTTTKSDYKDTSTVESDAGTNEADRALDIAKGEVITAPTLKEILRIFISPQTLALTFPYFCSFGGELAINSILGSYYLKNFPYLGQTGSGRWAAMFGLLNVVTRPAGGFISDLIYKYTKGSLWAKKMWIHFVGVMTGALLIVIGILDPHNLGTMIGLIAVMAFFHEAGNGANFALVPHVHPHANGVLSGMVGATGNCEYLF